MAPKQDVRSRAPRGTKTVAQAFFAALGDIGTEQQVPVATAALAAIRDTLKTRRAKMKQAKAAAKAKAPAKKKAARKVPAAKRAKRAVAK